MEIENEMKYGYSRQLIIGALQNVRISRIYELDEFHE